MRRVMLLAAMLAMVLAAAAPAFAQNVTAIDEGDDVEYNAVCQNILGQVGDIDSGNNADQSVMADRDSAAAAKLAQESGVTIEQANECLNEADLDGDGFVEVVELEEFGVVVVEGGAAAVVQYGGGGQQQQQQQQQVVVGGGGGGTTAVLPETGGASLIALGAGALLVAGGLIARRMVR